jgi:hypothetical protein
MPRTKQTCRRQPCGKAPRQSHGVAKTWKDHDHVLNFWLKGIPYVWLPDEDIYKCRRLYIIDESIFIYDEECHKTTFGRQEINYPHFIKDWEEHLDVWYDLYGSLDIFSLLKICEKDCEVVRNCFLVWIHPITLEAIQWYCSNYLKIENFDVRIEGTSVVYRNIFTREPQSMLTILYQGEVYKELMLEKSDDGKEIVEKI